MDEILKGWKKAEDIYVPSRGKVGYKEFVQIRKRIEPIADDDETIIANDDITSRT